MPIAGRCICCGARLVTEREAVRCQACQDAGRWPRPDDDPDRAALDAAVVDVPPHRRRQGWRMTTHAEGLALLGMAPEAPDLTAGPEGRIIDAPTSRAPERSEPLQGP